jgi:V/A-type H+-transporting ATPase subunit C
MSVHLRERALLSKQDIGMLSAAGDIGRVYALLGDRGWNTAGLTALDAGKLLAEQEYRAWEFVENLLGSLAHINVLRIPNDYHNLKAAIKLVYSNAEPDSEGYFLKGSIDISLITTAAVNNDFSMLPQDMAKAGKEAYIALAQTRNGQVCDMIIDKATLVAIDIAGRETKCGLLREYATLTIDSANIKAAARCRAMGKPREFAERAIAPAGALDAQRLITSATTSFDALYAYLYGTRYSGAVNELKNSIAAFERWCDNMVIHMIRPQRNNFYSIEPVVAYLLACIIEIRTVKFILSAKINNLDMNVITERLRDAYV